METALYPASPANIDFNKLEPSAGFKKEVGKVIFSIILFFAVYVALVLASIGLAIASFYAGGWIIIMKPGLYTLLIGLGLMLVGISVVFFLVKFIFAVSKDEKATRVEITEAEQPKLFAFIRQLTKETNTPFPNKIYVSPDVNACVFYNSGFWSMFFPVRKNLEIGLGLVNTVNISEFKAVMAHEFGHFSQRSMKLGSFTYNMNRIIYNMLYENEGYSSFLQGWASISNFTAFFASITAKIAQGIQSVLREMYKLINKNYMGLSREMEFHADGIAASVAGGNNLVSSLSRLELAANSYDTVLQSADDWLKEKKKSKNVFLNQTTVLHSIAGEHALSFKNGLPDVSPEFLQRFHSSRINYKNQWASHPTLEERKAHLDTLGFEIAASDASAWIIFDNPEALQVQLTDKVYSTVPPSDETVVCDEKMFAEWFTAKKEIFSLPTAYNGFYDGRFIEVNEWDIPVVAYSKVSKSFGDLFSKENGQLQSAINSNTNDLAIVEAIKRKDIDVKTFDFDGKKYSVKDCDTIIAQLEQEIDDQKKLQSSLDKEAFAFFYQLSAEKNEQLKKAYEDLKNQGRQTSEYVNVVNKVMETVQPFYRGGMTIEEVNLTVSAIKDHHEILLKDLYRKFLDANMLSGNKELEANVRSFTEKQYYYFVSNTIQANELNELCSYALQTVDVLNENRFQSYKKMLQLQLETISGN